MVRTCQWTFIRCNKYTTLLGDADGSGGKAGVGAGGLWGISVSPSQLSCEPKTTLKNKVHFSKELGLSLLISVSPVWSVTGNLKGRICRAINSSVCRTALHFKDNWGRGVLNSVRGQKSFPCFLSSVQPSPGCSSAPPRESPTKFLQARSLHDFLTFYPQSSASHRFPSRFLPKSYYLRMPILTPWQANQSSMMELNLMSNTTKFMTKKFEHV